MNALKKNSFSLNIWKDSKISCFMQRPSTPLHCLLLMLCNHGNWPKSVGSSGWPVIYRNHRIEYLRISCWHSITCRGSVELLMHAPLLVIWRMILCASPQSVLHSSPFHPLTHSWSHTVWLACTHLLYVWEWLQANSNPRCWSREFRGEVNWSLVLFLQEHVHLKQMKEGVGFTTGCPSLQVVWFELSRLLADS